MFSREFPKPLPSLLLRSCALSCVSRYARCFGGTGGTKFHGKPIRLIIHCTTTTTTTTPDPITPTPATGQSTLDSKLQS
ncbi:hypothetical protein VTJ04DRAFT_4796 [Mycothermus thermophilus]|uniref:uncharacterized protein n=1 Tax=Humicola insolens TaxID=85995 RepID=UPI00374253EE